MYERPRLIMAMVFLLGLLLTVSIQALAGFNDRAPRILAIAVVAIGLRWGSIAGAYLGALGGLILALYAGEPPFAAAAALAAAGLLAGEIPARFVLETYRSIALSAATACLLEVLLVSLMRGVVPPHLPHLVVWTAGWAAALGMFFYWLAARLSMPPPAPRIANGDAEKE